MADDKTTIQIENLTEITLPEFVEMVKQMRHNQRRCELNPTPKKVKTRNGWEQKVDFVIAELTDTQLQLWK